MLASSVRLVVVDSIAALARSDFAPASIAGGPCFLLLVGAPAHFAPCGGRPPAARSAEIAARL